MLRRMTSSHAPLDGPPWQRLASSTPLDRARPLLAIAGLIATPILLAVGLHHLWPPSPEPQSLIERWTPALRWAERGLVAFAIVQCGVQLGAGSAAAYAVVRGRTPLVLEVVWDACTKAPSLLWLQLQCWALTTLLWVPLLIAVTRSRSDLLSTTLVAGLAVVTIIVTAWLHVVYLVMAPVFVDVQGRSGRAAARAARALLPPGSRRTAGMAGCYAAAAMASAFIVIGWPQVVSWLLAWVWPAGTGWDDILNRDYMARVAYGLLFPASLLVPCVSLVAMWLFAARIVDDALTATRQYEDSTPRSLRARRKRVRVGCWAAHSSCGADKRTPCAS